MASVVEEALPFRSARAKLSAIAWLGCEGGPMEGFIATIGGFETSEAVLAALVAKARPFGMDCVAIGELPTEGVTRLRPFFYSTWPQSWYDIYTEQGIVAGDPVVAAARRASLPFSWSDVMRDLERWSLRRSDLMVFDLLRDHGWANGLAVPAHGPDGYHGLVSYAGKESQISMRARAALQVMGLYAHDRLLTLHERDPAGRRIAAPPGALTEHEAETLRLMAAGSSDGEVAAKLCVSERTVLYYVHRARGKLGCRSRAQLIAEALRRGILR